MITAGRRLIKLIRKQEALIAEQLALEAETEVLKMETEVLKDLNGQLDKMLVKKPEPSSITESKVN
jgi:hypothetical protein